MPDPADLWPQIEAQYDAALHTAQGMLRDRGNVLEAMRTRYLAGCEEFRGDWLTRPMDWFPAEAMDEAADLLVYLAMARVREAMD